MLGVVGEAAGTERGQRSFPWARPLLDSSRNFTAGCARRAGVAAGPCGGTSCVSLRVETHRAVIGLPMCWRCPGRVRARRLHRARQMSPPKASWQMSEVNKRWCGGLGAATLPGCWASPAWVRAVGSRSRGHGSIPLAGAAQSLPGERRRLR